MASPTALLLSYYVWTLADLMLMLRLLLKVLHRHHRCPRLLLPEEVADGLVALAVVGRRHHHML